jgi:hypothetical protein
MQIVVILYSLGNNDKGKKGQYMFSIDAIFFQRFSIYHWLKPWIHNLQIQRYFKYLCILNSVTLKEQYHI